MPSEHNKFNLNTTTQQELTGYHIPPTKKTPEVFLSKEKGLLIINGRSIPTRANDFYFPVMRKIEEYIKNPQEHTKAVFNLEYLDSASSKLLLAVIMRLRTVSEDNSLEIDWYYTEDDHDMMELGRMFSQLTGCKMNFRIAK